jgi:hypothetical protein
MRGKADVTFSASVANVRFRREALREAGLPRIGEWQPCRLPPVSLLAGRLVCATKLACLFPNLHNFVLRKQTSEFWIADGTG